MRCFCNYLSSLIFVIIVVVIAFFFVSNARHEWDGLDNKWMTKKREIHTMKSIHIGWFFISECMNFFLHWTMMLDYVEYYKECSNDNDLEDFTRKWYVVSIWILYFHLLTHIFTLLKIERVLLLTLHITS